MLMFSRYVYHISHLCYANITLANKHQTQYN